MCEILISDCPKNIENTFADITDDRFRKMLDLFGDSSV